MGDINDIILEYADVHIVALESHARGVARCTDRAKEILRHGMFTTDEYRQGFPQGFTGSRTRSGEERARRQKRAQKRARRRRLAAASRRQNRRTY